MSDLEMGCAIAIRVDRKRYRSKAGLVVSLVLASLVAMISAASAQQQELSGLLRLAQQYERLGDFERALSAYGRLLDTVPTSQVYWEGVKRNLLQLKRYDELLARTRQRLQILPDPRLEADLADVTYKMGQTDKAMQIWRSVIDRQKRDPAVYQIVAQSMLENRLYDEAVEVYKLGRERLKAPTLFVFDLANLYIARSDLKGAVQEYLDYLQREPRQFTYVEGRISAATDERQKAEEVISILEEQLQKGSRGPVVHRLLAGLYVRTGEFDKALQEYLSLESLPSPEKSVAVGGADLLSFAQQAARAGALKTAQSAYETIVEKYPASSFTPRARLALAEVFQQQGLFDEAERVYENMLELQPNTTVAYEARFQIGEIQLGGLFDPRAAIVSFGEVIEKYPKSSRRFDAMLRTGDAYLALGDLQNAEEWYTRPLALGGQTPVGGIERAQYKLAYLAFLRERYDDALQQLRDITRNVGRGNPGAGESLINDALELTLIIQENRNQSPAAFRLYVQALRLDLQHRYDESIDVLSTLLAESPKASIADDALLKIGDILAAEERYTDAVSAYERLLDEYPTSVLSDLALKKVGETYETNLKDTANAQRAYERLLEEHPDSIYLEQVRHRLRSLENRVGS